MNCQDVESIITEIARNHAPEVEADAGVVAHLKECRRCADRLAAEQGLTYELLVWNAACLQEQAPPRVEANLRAAFRRNSPRARRPWLKFAAAGSIAAGLLLFKLLAPAPKVEVPVVSVATTPAPAPAPVIVASVTPPVQTSRKKRQAKRVPHLPPVPSEVGTEFLPVAQGDGWTPLDGGRLVRVGLPRSAMGAFGLPVNEGLATDRVQADVMLSDDGLLRAIRFVK